MSGSTAAAHADGESRPGRAGGPPTTAGVIAMGNLDVRIEGLTAQATRGRLTADGWGELVELTVLRGQVRGRIDEVEGAVSLAGSFVDRAPRDPRSLVARARVAGLFHRFAAALDDLDAAAALGLDRRAVDEERAAVCQAVGRYDEALALLRQGLSGRRDFRTLGAMARWHAERGEADEAETWFLAARRAYRGVSPFPPAVLEFQCGQMWMDRGGLVSARSWLESAVRRLPSYVPAQGHLAETDAAEGRTPEAAERLRRLALASDDPDYATRLARLLDRCEVPAEARLWRAYAAARYEELTARHPEAYADHAAEFWLTVGGDPWRALRLARQNLALRATPRAQALVNRAMCRVGQCRQQGVIGTNSAGT
ncbi:lipopolysaccharide assembly protein LapB [Streptomyces sp. MUSC 14]|uniref:tetratricopeptide repeat protein n=1 Tax=Streptomyces sp. MUSC 14 TaxID=1354889 RepID=UPI000A850663|nr:tetratricopeptide repeat protein [Streptomyces sp. MUSC 14]